MQLPATSQLSEAVISIEANKRLAGNLKENPTELENPKEF